MNGLTFIYIIYVKTIAANHTIAIVNLNTLSETLDPIHYESYKL